MIMNEYMYIFLGGFVSYSLRQPYRSFTSNFDCFTQNAVKWRLQSREMYVILAIKDTKQYYISYNILITHRDRHICALTQLRLHIFGAFKNKISMS